MPKLGNIPRKVEWINQEKTSFPHFPLIPAWLCLSRSCFQSNTFEMTPPPPPKNFSSSLSSSLVLARSISVNEQNEKKVSLIDPDAEAGFECEGEGVQWKPLSQSFRLCSLRVCYGLKWVKLLLWDISILWSAYLSLRGCVKLMPSARGS